MILQKPSTVRSYVDKNSFEEVARDVKPEDVPTDFKGYGSGKPIILTSSNERSNKIDYCSKKSMWTWNFLGAMAGLAFGMILVGGGSGWIFVKFVMKWFKGFSDFYP